VREREKRERVRESERRECVLCIVSSNLAFRTFEINTVKLTAFTKIAISVLNSCSYYDTVIVKALLSDIV